MTTDTNTTPGLGTKITVRIGMGGRKLHPAYAEKLPNGRYRIGLFSCSCGGTHNGSAAQRAQIVAEGWQLVNCGEPHK